METLLQIAAWLFLPFVVVVAYVAAEAFYYQCRLGPGLERDLGFHEGAAYISVGRWMHSAVCIEDVSDEGVFAEAGFRAGDVLPVISHTDLFKLLHRHRGREAELTVVDGGEGPPFQDRPKRVIRFTVPPQGYKV